MRMFDFEKLSVYQKAKSINSDIYSLIKNEKFDRTTNDQLRRASFSIMLNIAEVMSRFSRKDRRNFMVISRGSAYECAAILDYLKDQNQISLNDHNMFYAQLEDISKMLFGLIRKLE